MKIIHYKFIFLRNYTYEIYHRIFLEKLFIFIRIKNIYLGYYSWGNAPIKSNLFLINLSQQFCPNFP